MLGYAELPIAILAWFLVIGIVLIAVASLGILIVQQLELKEIKEKYKPENTKIDLRA